MERLKNWLCALFEEFDSNAENDFVEMVLEKCGSNCAKTCGVEGIAAKAKSEVQDINNLDEVVRAVQKYFGGKFTAIKNGFITEFGKGKCVCPMVSQQYINSKSLCSCTKGFNEKVWSVFFERPVSVEIISSVLRGGDECRLKIEIIDDK